MSTDSALAQDERIDLETLRFIRDGAIPEWVPHQRLTGLGRRGLAHRGSRWFLTLAGRRLLATLSDREPDPTTPRGEANGV